MATYYIYGTNIKYTYTDDDGTDTVNMQPYLYLNVGDYDATTKSLVLTHCRTNVKHSASLGTGYNYQVKITSPKIVINGTSHSGSTISKETTVTSPWTAYQYNGVTINNPNEDGTDFEFTVKMTGTYSITRTNGTVTCKTATYSLTKTVVVSTGVSPTPETTYTQPIINISNFNRSGATISVTIDKEYDATNTLNSVVVTSEPQAISETVTMTENEGLYIGQVTFSDLQDAVYTIITRATDNYTTVTRQDVLSSSNVPIYLYQDDIDTGVSFGKIHNEAGVHVDLHTFFGSAGNTINVDFSNATVTGLPSGGGSSPSSVVTVQQYLDSGTLIGGVTVNGTQTKFYAPSQVSDEHINSLIDNKVVPTQRSLEYLWKLNKGQTWDFETDDTEAHTKAIPSGAKGGDLLEVGGKSVVYNQFIGEMGNTCTGATGYSIELSNNNRTVTSSFQSVSAFNYNLIANLSFVKDHKYLLSGVDKFTSDASTTALRFYETGTGVLFSEITPTQYAYRKIITCLLSTTSNNGRIYLDCGSSDTNVVFNATPLLVDLTECFGTGNEPTSTTDARIIALEKYALAQPSYNAGEIINTNVSSVSINGANIWNEQWELGTINATTGALQNTSISIRTKDYIEVNDYDNYIAGGNFGQQTVKTRFYDSDYAYIGSSNKNGNSVVMNTAFVPPLHAKYMKIAFPTEYGTTYNNDFIVAKSSSVVSYTPYVETQTINLTNHNLKSAGSVYDYVDYERKKIVRRIGSVDMGTLTWTWSEGNLRYVSNVISDMNATVDERLNGLLCFYPIDNNSYLTTQMTDNTCKRYGGKVVLKDTTYNGDVEALTNYLSGKTLYYELATPYEEDITEELEAFDCEANGEIVFNSNIDMPIPNEVQYIVKLNEVQ